MNLATEEFISPYNPNNIKPLRLEDKYGLSNTRRPNLRNSKEIFVRDYYDIDNFTYYLWFSFFENFKNLKCFQLIYFLQNDIIKNLKCFHLIYFLQNDIIIIIIIIGLYSNTTYEQNSITFSKK